MSKLVCNVVITVALAISVGAAQADEIVTQQTKVSLRGLQLDREVDAYTLVRRVDRAAAKVCGGRPAYQTTNSLAVQRFEQCREAAVLSAMQRIDHPVVWAAYRKATQSEQAALAKR